MKGVRKFRNWVTWPRPRPLIGRFMVHTQDAYVLYVCTKFESDSSIRSKVIRVPKFRNWDTWPRPRPLRVVLWSTRRRGPSSIYVPNLKRIAQFVQKLLRGSQNLEIRSRDPGHAHLWVVFRLDALAKALSVIATVTWLAGWVAGWLGGWLAGCHTPVLYQNR